MEDLIIPVPYGDFVDGQKALADLDSIRAILIKSHGYCSDSILAILGLEINKSGIGVEKVNVRAD